MKNAFTSEADFSNMTKEESLLVQEVFHKAYMKVDEEGTEAAAVTKVVMSRCFVMTQTYEMNVNRPFLFILREKTLNQMLFIAKIEKVIE